MASGDDDDQLKFPALGAARNEPYEPFGIGDELGFTATGVTGSRYLVTIVRTRAETVVASFVGLEKFEDSDLATVDEMLLHALRRGFDVSTVSEVVLKSNDNGAIKIFMGLGDSGNDGDGIICRVSRTRYAELGGR